MSLIIKSILLSAFLLSFCLFSIPHASKAAGNKAVEKETKPTYPDVIVYGVMANFPNINSKEAQVALKFNVRKRTDTKFPNSVPQIEVIPDVETGAKMINSGKLHSLSLTGLDYVMLRKLADVEPLFISTKTQEPVDAYVLIADNHLNLKKLALQKERKLIVESDLRPNIGELWLNTVLWNNGYKESELFFSSIRAGDTPMRIVLPVFFGQAEAGLLSESAFNIMVKLNPQIGEKLTVLLRSPGFVNVVTCVPRQINKDIRDVLLDESLDLVNQDYGKQLLLVFHLKNNISFKNEYLEETEKLFDLYEKKRKSLETERQNKIKGNAARESLNNPLPPTD